MALSTLEVVAFFTAVIYLPLADVITYYLACPIFVTALWALVLREKVGWRRWSAVGIGFCGVLIALRPSADAITWPALIRLPTEPLAALLAFAVLAIGLAALSFALIGRAGPALRGALALLGLGLLFGPVLI